MAEISYTKTNWVNNVTKLNADNMNHIENGIEALDVALNTKASVDYVNKTHYGYSGDDLLIIPDGTTTIGDFTYSGTTYKCVVIPDSVTSIGAYAFAGCGSLTSITIPNSVTSIGSVAFSGCSGLTNITIPSNITDIGMAVFESCTGLTSITIPSSVTNISEGAFYQVPLQIIDLTAYVTESFPTLDTNNFAYIASDCQIKVIKGRKSELAAMTNWSAYADHIVEVPTVETVDAELTALQTEVEAGLAEKAVKTEVDAALETKLDKSNVAQTTGQSTTSVMSQKATTDEIDTLKSDVSNIKSGTIQQTPLFANSIAECTDTTKLYVLPDGYIYAYKKTTVKVDPQPNFTNQLPISTDESGAIYNGIGYKEGYRVSSSGTEKVAAGYFATGLIPCTSKSTIRIKNATVDSSGLCTVVYYNNDKTYAGGTIGYLYADGTVGDDGTISFVTRENATDAYVRLTLNNVTAETIVTVNEEITYTEGGTTEEYAWVNTGHTFVAPDNAKLMFISPDGNDSNDGKTVSTPKKTVRNCVLNGATRISAKRGIYNQNVFLVNIGELEIFPTDNDKTYAVGEEKREPIIFDTSDNIDVLSLTAYNSIKRTTYSNSGNTAFNRVFVNKSLTPVVGDGYGSRYNATIWLLSSDEKTVCVKLKPVLTVAECEAEANTFTYIDGYVYINADFTSVTKIVVPTNWETGFYISGAQKVVLHEVEVRFSGAYNIDIRNCDYFDFYKCSCKYTNYASGFHPYNSNGIMTACYATKNFDGYGISGYGHTTFVDCISEYNFDDGMSHHNGCEGLVIGGRYEGNGKGGNTPAYGAKVDIYGGLYKNNVGFGIGYLWASGLTPASGTVQGATMIGNPIGLSVNANCVVTAMSCVYKDNTEDTNVKGTLNIIENSESERITSLETDVSQIKAEISKPLCTNVLSTATSADRATVYEGVGYKTNTRLNSSGGEAERSSMCVSGYIPVNTGDVLRIKGISPKTSVSSYIFAYNSENVKTGGGWLAQNGDPAHWEQGYYDSDSDMFIIPLTANDFGSGFDAIRFSAGIIDVNTIVTINEEIAGSVFDVVKQNRDAISAIERATGVTADDTEQAAINRIKNWTYPIFEDAPVFLLDTPKSALSQSDYTTEAVYAKYDALMAAHSDYITREDCGLASDNSTHIYVYHFKESEPHYASSDWSETKPVLLICSGIHPTEMTGIYSLYNAMEEITTNSKLLDLRRNLHFIIMPIINPTGLSDATYGVRNPDGIQAHYNFEVDFRYPGTSGYVPNGNRNYGGETPLSIPETQYFDNLMKTYKDTIACVISCHNNDVDTIRGTGVIWCSCASNFTCNLGFRFVDKMSAAWREKYGTAFDEGVAWANAYALQKAEEGSSIFDSSYVKTQPSWDYRVGMASISSSGGTEYKQALKYGIHGLNVETCDRCLILDKDFSKTRTANVMTIGTETYINFFRTYMAVYDPKNKKDYAPNLPWVTE